MKWQAEHADWAASTPDQLRDWARMKWGLYIDGLPSDRADVVAIVYELRFWMAEHRPDLVDMWEEEFRAGRVRLANKKAGAAFPYTNVPQEASR